MGGAVYFARLEYARPITVCFLHMQPAQFALYAFAVVVVLGLFPCMIYSWRMTPLSKRRRTFRGTRADRRTHKRAGLNLAHQTVQYSGFGECTSHPHTRVIEQTNSGASHFKTPKSRFCPSEAVQAKSDSTPFVLDGLTRPGSRILRPSETGVVSISALQTNIQRRVGLL